MRPVDLTIEELRLDPDNPRVPETIGRSQRDLLSYSYENGALAELAESFLDNGYFAPERLIVRQDADGYVVIEGNRRLATLMILHQMPAAEGMRLTDDPVTDEQLTRLRAIPCLVLDAHERVEPYLAYRHIGGLKTWSPEAKARFIKRLVGEVVAEGVTDVFRVVGRRVGSNALGVRTPFLALAVLESGRSDHSVDTRYVQYSRFGVWVRCMNSTDIRSFIGLGDPRTYDEVVSAVQAVDGSALVELIGDLTPSPGRKAVLQDSRDVTDYGRVLVDERAHSALRKYDNLDVARQIVNQEALPERVGRISADLDLIMEEVYRLERSAHSDVLGHELRRESERLFGVARSLRSAVRDIFEDD